MTEAVKHTPGPWRIAAPPDKVCTGYGDERDYTGNGSAKTIVVCCRRAWMVGGEEFANAALIAAAPELLEALRCADDILCEGEEPNNKDIMRALEVMRAAIAKAEGRS